MSDVICPRCGEPWDMDCLHDEAGEHYGATYGEPGYVGADYQKVYQQVSADFRTRGCLALTEAFGPQTCVPVASHSTMVAQAMYELLGDDLDAASVMTEDYSREPVAGYIESWRWCD